MLKRTAVPSRAEIDALVDAGRLREAAAVIDAVNDPPLGLRVMRLYVERYVGDIQAAASGAEKLLALPLTDRDRVICWQIIGEVNARQGRTEKGIALLRKALSLAQTVDRVTYLLALAVLADTVLQRIGIEAASTEILQLRRLALLYGHARSLISAHTLAAEVDVKRHEIGGATAHINAARALLAEHHNHVQAARVALAAANAAIYETSLDSAFALCTDALASARLSGARSVLLPARSSMTHALLRLGRLDDAERVALELIENTQMNDGRMVGLDTYAEVLLTKGDLSSTRTQLKRAWEISRQLDNGYSLYGVWLHLTTAKYLTASGRHLEAAECGLKALDHMGRIPDRNLAVRLYLAMAEAYAGAGAVADAINYLQHASGMAASSPELTAYGQYIAGLIRSHDNDDISRSYLHRSRRLLEAAGVHATIYGPGAAANTEPADRSSDACDASEALESIRVMCDVAAHPKVAIAELVALVQRLGSAQAAAVTEHGGDGPRQVAGFGTLPAVGELIRVDLFRTGDHWFEFTAAPSTGSAKSLELIAVARILRYVDEVFKWRRAELERSSPWMPTATTAEGGLIVAAPSMVELFSTARRVATTKITVLITGETGTGKELLARALHDASPRAAHSFLPFNCSAVPRDMLAAQLFGHKRGAFTGATEAFPGVIRAAAGGTLFLDEIGELSLEVQPKLLRFLESGEIHPLGEAKPITVDVRVVAATNVNLEQLVTEGKFREDLFYRLDVVRLEVPPLRERREEIPLLVQHYIDRASRESQKSGIRIAEETMEYLVLYRWPGNVRQLANEVRRCVALAESGAVIMPEHLSRDVVSTRRTVPASERDLAPTEFVVRMDQPMSAATDHLERAMIHYALKLAGGRVEQAAHILGLSRKGLYLKRQRFGIDLSGEPPDDEGQDVQSEHQLPR